MEQELDLKYIRSKLQNILDKTHRENQKKVIKDFPERFNCACPLCGDSEKVASKKRGNLYIDNMRFKCFNCGESMSFTQLCDHFKEQIDMEQRIQLYNYIDTHTKFKNNNSDYILEEMDLLIDIDKFVEYFNNKPNSWLYDIKPVEKNSHVYHYLKYERLIEDFSQIYQGIYRVIRDGKKVFETKVMINMNILKSDNKLLGIQLRNLERDKAKRFFKIVDFEELYNYMNPSKQLDEITAIPYNKLSHFFNILNIDFEQPITIFESFLDSLFVSNSIGLIGTNSVDDAMNFLLNSDESLNIRFFLDADEPADKKNEQLLRKGHSVFLWNMLFDKLIDKVKDKNTASIIYKNIKDLNELVVKSKDPNIYHKLKLDKFFSKDKFDILYINKKSNQLCQKSYQKKKY